MVNGFGAMTAWSGLSIRAEILAGDRSWRAAEFLLDTGADRTVIAADVLERLSLPRNPLEGRIVGVGGFVESATVTTQIQFTRDDGQGVQFRGAYVACTDQEALDMSVLGRDILDMFAVIVDRSADMVAMLGGNHYYTVGQR